MHSLRVAPRPHWSPSHLLACLSLATRQYGEVFNQPLSWNTSSVTTMERMFDVRALASTSSRELFPACSLRSP